MSIFYRLLKFLIGIALQIYFKKIEIVGLENVPKNGPLLVTPNHQNAFLDAFLVGSLIPRNLHFLTRSDVFTWWSKPLFGLVNMIPVYRIRDGFQKLSLNESIFKACQELFTSNKCVLVFAEGNHGKHHFLRPLTKGAARIALQSVENSNDLKVLPVGLNFFQHQAPNSKVILVFGQPISVNDYFDAYSRNKQDGLKELTKAISNGMKDTLVIPEETEDYESLKNKVFNSANELISFRDLKNKEYTQGDGYNGRKHYVAWAFNPLPLLIIHLTLNRVKDIVFHSSFKFSFGLILFPIWWIIAYLTMNYFHGTYYGVITVSIMVITLFLDYKWLK